MLANQPCAYLSPTSFDSGRECASSVRPWLRADERERRLVAASGLFDASYYLINGADVMSAGADPVLHFCDHGWRENRRLNLFFDPDWYRSRDLAVTGPEINPLVHYLREGERAGCRPIPFFDPAWYRSAYGLKANASPLAHSLAQRRTQCVAPTPLFDLAFYFDRHGHEIGPNRDPSCTIGATARRDATSTRPRASTRPPTDAR